MQMGFQLSYSQKQEQVIAQEMWCSFDFFYDGQVLHEVLSIKDEPKRIGETKQIQRCSPEEIQKVISNHLSGYLSFTAEGIRRMGGSLRSKCNATVYGTSRIINETEPYLHTPNIDLVVNPSDHITPTWREEMLEKGKQKLDALMGQNPGRSYGQWEIKPTYQGDIGVIVSADRFAVFVQYDHKNIKHLLEIVNDRERPDKLLLRIYEGVNEEGRALIKDDANPIFHGMATLDALDKKLIRGR